MIVPAHSAPEIFDWGLGMEPMEMPKRQQDVFDVASKFGIRYGFTITIHECRGPIAAVTLERIVLDSDLYGH